MTDMVFARKVEAVTGKRWCRYCRSEQPIGLFTKAQPQKCQNCKDNAKPPQVPT